MSHFIGICFTFGGEGILDMNLEPYDEQTEDKEYLEFVDCTEEVEGEFKSLPEVDEKIYDNGQRRDKDLAHYPTIEEFAEDWFGYKKQDGRWGYVTNPKAKWDWYAIGNRWDGYLYGKNGKEYNRLSFDEVDWEKMFTPIEQTYTNFEGKEETYTETHIPFCFVDTDGEWHERAEMGWFACTSNEKDVDVWEKEVKDYVKSIQDLPEEEREDIMVWAVDFHI